MSSPPPPAASESASSTAASEDWRSSVEQSYRNKEVREIAKLLASLEPNSTFASKLRLATQFENGIFTTADSLADYRKKIVKRLKKISKNYKPPAAPATPAEDASQKKLLELKQKYGETLRFIVKNAPSALKHMQEKAGAKKAQQLQVHTDNAKQWAVELGVLDGKGPPVKPTSVDKLQTFLEQRVDNIRSHVVKLAMPDLFLKETIQKLEPDFSKDASKILAASTKRHLSTDEEREQDFLQMLTKSHEKAQTPIPPPSTQNKEQAQKEEALLHLEKMRAASQVFVAYMALEDKTGVPPQVLTKSYDVAVQGAKELSTITATKPGENQKTAEVTLQDVWNKVLELPHDEHDDANDVEDAAAQNASSSKRIKMSTNHKKPTIRSRVLLTPCRKTPSNLLPELKRKRAKLVRPEPDGHGSYLELEFGKAFTMTIYLVPLLVRISEMSSRNEYTIWGVTGSRELLGHVVQERLRYASAQATAVLRQCFASTGLSPSRSDFEVEISEATALLQFIQLARTTYMPQWQDVDDA